MRLKIVIPFLMLMIFSRISHKNHHLAATEYAGIFASSASVPPRQIPVVLQPNKTRYLFVITTDGLRWQEVYGGVDSILLRNTDYVKDTAWYKQTYWHRDANRRREKLMPFFWNHLSKNGQLYGNRYAGNYVNTANRMWFSYPGYNELFSGSPDDGHIFSNSKWTNPNENVFEFLNKTAEYNGKIAAFATWDVFSAIFREKKSGVNVQCGGETTCEKTKEQGIQQFGNRQIPPDFHTWTTAISYIKNDHPSISFIGLDDTDSRAHEGHYDQYIDAAHRFDHWLSEFWDFIQNDSLYRNQTTLLLSTDHGRGQGKHWTSHGMLVSGSDAIWIAALGPDTPAFGEVKQPMQLYQKQVAQTIAQLLGHTFYTDRDVAPAIESVFQKPAEGSKSDQPLVQACISSKPIPVLIKK